MADVNLAILSPLFPQTGYDIMARSLEPFFRGVLFHSNDHKLPDVVGLE